MGMEDDFLQNDVDDEKTIEYIKNYLPQELKEKFSDDEFYYFLDLIDEYYSESGILDVQPDGDGFLKNSTVGILRIPYSAATSPFSSTSHLPISALPSYSPASSSMIGPTILQGPHHGAQKSITTGLPSARISLKLLSVISNAISSKY